MILGFWSQDLGLLSSFPQKHDTAIDRVGESEKKLVPAGEVATDRCQARQKYDREEDNGGEYKWQLFWISKVGVYFARRQAGLECSREHGN